MAVISFVITSINALFACLHFHDILSEHPGGYHPSGALGIQPQFASQLLSLLIRELIWQKLQHIGRPSFARLHSLLLRLHDSISEESHLAVQVILLAPAHKLLYLGFPLATIRHIEHASLQIGNDIGSEREVLVNPVLAHTGKVGILLFQLLCQGESLRAIDSTRSHVKMLDIGF